MSEHLSIEQRRWGAVIPAHLTPKQTRFVLFAAGNRLLSELQPDDPCRQYAAHYLGVLFRLAADREQAADVLEGVPGCQEPVHSLGGMVYAAKTEMRLTFGDPQLVDVDSPCRPVDYAASVNAQEATTLVRMHIGAELIGE
ncbi:MAG TPA: hypothetical protein VMR45_06020 [Patescibacteria group bacterium]|nr:hypothetical protein [Patescibacteria group bacterium]